MPEMDGVEATRVLRERDDWAAHVPVLALTANASRDDRRRCIEAGMNAFLTKPIERAKLLAGVEELLKTDLLEPHADIACGAPSQAVGPLFDYQAIERNFGDLPDLFIGVIEQFETELFERLHKAETALEDGEIKMAGKEGHAIKGAASNVECRILSIAAKELEDAGLAGDFEEAHRALACLKQVASQAASEIRNLPLVRQAS